MPDIEFLKKLPCPTEGRLPEWYFTFGQRIIILRRALSWSQAHAERMLHAGEGVVRQHEARRRRRPRLALLLRLRRLEAEYMQRKSRRTLPSPPPITVSVSAPAGSLSQDRPIFKRRWAELEQPKSADLYT